MLTVQEFLRMNIASTFRVAAGREGLYNRINNIGIHDYEGLEEIESTFFQGDFVLATFATCQNSPEEMEKYLTAIIMCKVSCIAIKEKFFNNISEEVRNLAAKNKVSVFFYSVDVYPEDIIAEVKSALKSSEMYVEKERQLIRYLENELSKDEEGKFLLEINPMEYHYTVAIYIKKRDKNNRYIISQLEKHAIINNHLVEKDTTSFIPFKEGTIIFRCMKQNDGLDVSSISDYLDTLGLKEKECYMGIDYNNDDKHNIKHTIINSINAHYIAQIWLRGKMEYSNVGIYKYLLPIKPESIARHAYDKNITIIKNFDRDNNLHLLDTIMCYTANNGEIGRTAISMQQHANTIRYRLKKITQLLNLDEGKSEGAYEELYALTSLHRYICLVEE